MEGYLSLRIQPWVRRIITRIVAIAPAFIAIVYFGDSATGDLLVLSQVVLNAAGLCHNTAYSFCEIKAV
jgi:manganese transport protein